MKKIIATILVIMFLFVWTGVDFVHSAGETPVTINVDTTKTYQTIDGFGFFGAQDVWWTGNNAGLVSDAWLTKIVSDMGITMWRNELQPYNPVDSLTASNSLDAPWSKQKDMIIALKNKAAALGEPLKVILTVWSPPGEFKINCTIKWAGDTAATRGGAHNSTKNGGTLDPTKYAAYAQWLIDGLNMYKNIGVDVYAISLQNELLFSQTFNSCQYTNAWYVDMLNQVVPIVKRSFPNVKIFGAESMLGMEADTTKNNFNLFYTKAIINGALNNIDVLAYHGYSDGVQATAIAQHKALWESAYKNFQVPSKKPSWMTETSGYVDTWLASASKPGALDLGIAIQSSLKYGKASAWVWWQGSGAGSGVTSEFSLMSGTNVGKKYYVSKQFYRYVRPGAVMVDAATTDTNLISSAYYSPNSKEFTSVLINTSATAKMITLTGANVPTSFTSYLTTSDANTNCKDMGVVNNGAIVLPANSIMTLVSSANLPIYTPVPTLTPTPIPTPTPVPTPTPTPTLSPTLSPTPSPVKVLGISINPPSAVLKTKSMIKLLPVFSPFNTTDRRIVWSSNNVNIASVSLDGKVTAKSPGNCIITAITLNPQKVATCKISVFQPVTSLKMSKTNLILEKGHTSKLKVSVYPTNASNKKIKWKSSNVKIVSVTQSGSIKGLKLGTAYIYAYSIDGLKSTKCKVIVKR